MNTEVICKRPFDASPVIARWCESSNVAGSYKTASGTVIVKHGHLTGGKSAGVEILLVDTVP